MKLSDVHKLMKAFDVTMDSFIELAKLAKTCPSYTSVDSIIISLEDQLEKIIS